MTELALNVSSNDSTGDAKTALHRLLRIAAAEGLDVDAFSCQQKIDARLLTVKGNPIDRRKYLTATSTLVQTLDIPDLGFRSGERFSLGDLGVLGHAILSSENIREALTIYLHYRQAFGSVFDVELREHHSSLIVATHLETGEAHLQRYLLENWLLSLSSLSSLQADGRQLFDSVSVPYAEPAYSDLYQQVFNCPVRYEQPTVTAVINAEVARQPLKYSNPTVNAFCKSECLKAIQTLKGLRAFDDIVKDHLLRARDEFPSPSELSQRMHMSERTFRRKLADTGTGYNKLLLDVRMQLAAEHQSGGNRSIKDIALTLGYKDVASYHRAFKSYYGVTPKTFHNG